jgi:hypothetical protein
MPPIATGNDKQRQVTTALRPPWSLKIQLIHFPILLPAVHLSRLSHRRKTFPNTPPAPVLALVPNGGSVVAPELTISGG